jgi:hypothetical protein
LAPVAKAPRGRGSATLERDVGSPQHLALHPFDRALIPQHGDLALYETTAVVAYLAKSRSR